jgi:uncharacterized protein (DUF302 family)
MPVFVSLIVAFFLSLLPGCAATGRGEFIRYYQASTTKPYADVLAELEVAITEQNFRITGHNKIGSVIREREGIDFPDYDTIQFCNLTLARQMLQLSPAAVRHMPCNIAVRDEHGRVTVNVRLLPDDTDNARLNDFARQMNARMKRMVDFAVEE